MLHRMNRAAWFLAVASLVCGRSAAVLGQTPAPAQDDSRVQYPAGLANSFVAVSAGSINYAFSQEHLEAGHRAGSIEVPHTAARVVLFGHHFGKYVSVQGAYMRPLKYVRYRDVDGSGDSHTVWMHFGTVSAQARLPISDRVSLFGEAGLAITNRGGFDVGSAPALKDAQFASPLFGGGVEYRLNRTLDLLVGSSIITPRSKDNNPTTIFTSATLRYTMRPVPPDRIAEVRKAGYIFPDNLVQVGYATDAFGFSLNDFFNETVPIFWGGDVKVKRSVVSLQWERNLFHTKKIFALDLGASFSSWRSRDDMGFRTLSVFPVLRFTFLRSTPADVYASFSQAGPTYISRVVIDGLPTGSHFTFQDFMALGVFFGPDRRWNLELNLNHYSNGNLMADNAGVMVPLALKFGYAF
jgi:lipid A 3-O-deacylase PagL/OmpA family protein